MEHWISFGTLDPERLTAAPPWDVPGARIRTAQMGGAYRGYRGIFVASQAPEGAIRIG